ncbi:MAG: hypothetical protein US96_C0012G0024 [Candidatus Woesebacteria bacterium GW2011_GWB1_38_5b]|uniref:Type II secretion system protein GspG C-terminal domain-containing protein n=1 Tax=Candidatus Woesebacteria bacterium GW2011_GWB1_38_5b TaxID=1618569 RepID=A0A0G0KIP8_9BACT|nr:MAG: hypothetical protein US96_C0012G0024 [Candidatus Woesebacteria bacterium GW2011_GWB1_38_5b]
MVFGFSKKEFRAVVIILLILSTAVFLNMQTALRRARDAQRKADIRNIYNALVAFQSENGHFPFSENGQIIGCGEETDEKGNPIFHACEWGWEGLADLNRVPGDPLHHSGYRYNYISNGRRYQIFASLESDEEPEYDLKVKARNLACGEKICNFGLGYSNAPLDRTLEQYEAEERKKELEKLNLN